jgi:hypothetical protein
MKNSVKKLIVFSLACCAVFGAAIPAYSQTTVQVDSTKSWGGWMNVYDNNGGSQGGYLWGSGWGIGALTAYFNGTNSVTIIPNTNCWNIADPYWVNPGPPPTGAKWMEANFYVDAGTAYAGQTVKFVGDVLTNTLESPYVSQAFIKEFAPGYAYVGMTTSNLVGGSGFLVERAIAPGNICQYGFITTGPDADPATVDSLGKVVIAVNNADPTITTMSGLALVEGQNATFSVTAQGTAPLRYQWTYVSGNTTNVLSDGGRISGATTNSLTISSVIPSDAGTYSVTVTNSKGTNFAMATLAIVPLSQAQTNYLIDPGFELGYFASSGEGGWFNFSGSAIQNTNNYYVGQEGEVHVLVVDGTNCCQLYAAATWNGIFQDRPALPGEIFTADVWALTPELDYIGGGNNCYLEVQFRTAADAVLRQYSSDMVDIDTPSVAWIHLTPTNIYDGTFTNFLGTSDYMVAPPGTAKVRYQITYHGYGGGYGSVYVDAATLVLRAPAVTASPNGASVDLSFATLYGPQYQVYYKTNLTETTWHTLGSPVTGDGTVKTVNDSAGTDYRFYIVNTVQ